MHKYLVVVVASVVLGVVSPFMVATGDGPVLRVWIQWLPIQVDQLFLPEGQGGMLLLAIVVLACQYLAFFAFMRMTVLRWLMAFLKPLLHRDLHVQVGR